MTSRLAMFGLAAGFVISGCSTRPSSPDAAAPVYPAGSRQGETLNIHVVRRETIIELTNTTDRTFGPSIVWLNGWFSRRIDGLAPGQSMVLRLAEFKDRYGQRFKAGGFWATEAPDKLMLAQLETVPDAPLLGLVVIGVTER